MTIKNTDLYNQIEEVYLSKYGIYYFFKDFIISEINEGVDFTWEVGEDLFPEIFKHYGKGASISYISNRINDYSVNPADWNKFFRNNNVPNLKTYAIVTYTEPGWVNSVIEQLFVRAQVKNFIDLYEAVDWVKQNNLTHK